MDRVQKFEQTEQINKYLEDKQVYELLLDLLKQLIVSKPADPLNFLIDKLQNPLVKRVFLMGPPTLARKEYAKRLREKFGMQLIETG